jgi:DNA polymerase-1
MPLLQADASQLEWRTAVELSHDEVGLQEIKDGEDTHSLNQIAFALPSRLIAKIYLFRTIFRGSGWAFANDNDFSHVSADPKFWDGVNEKFYAKYNGLAHQHNVWKDLVLGGQPIVGPLGREWLIPLTYVPGKEFKIPWTLLSNYPVQGTGADIMCIARISAYRRIKAAGIVCRFISTVHDSIVVDVPTEYLQQVADIFYDVFDDLQKNIWKLFKYNWQTPLACECKFGPNMRDMKKLPRSA